MTELGGDVKIPDIWRMSALLEMRHKDVRDQMLMRLDDIGELPEHQDEGDFILQDRWMSTT